MKVFISYRRADSQPTAGRMAQFLDDIDAVDGVFLDVDGIGIGENFEQKIFGTLQKVSHVFVLIGRAWRGPADAPGQARILEADDMVRLEVRAALASQAKLVPILIDDAGMPRKNELPADLQALALRNAFSLRNAHFDEDMDNLLDALIGKAGTRTSRWRLAPLTPAGIVARLLAGVAGAAVLLLLLAVVNHYAGPADCEDLVCSLKTTFHIAGDSDALGLLYMIVMAMLCLGAASPFAARALNRRQFISKGSVAKA